MTTSCYLQERGIITNQIIKFTFVMEETPIELCCWDMDLQSKETNMNICGLVLTSVTLWYISLILFKCWSKNIFLWEENSKSKLTDSTWSLSSFSDSIHGHFMVSTQLNNSSKSKTMANKSLLYNNLKNLSYSDFNNLKEPMI